MDKFDFECTLDQPETFWYALAISKKICMNNGTKTDSGHVEWWVDQNRSTSKSALMQVAYMKISHEGLDFIISSPTFVSPPL